MITAHARRSPALVLFMILLALLALIGGCARAIAPGEESQSGSLVSADPQSSSQSGEESAQSGAPFTGHFGPYEKDSEGRLVRPAQEIAAPELDPSANEWGCEAAVASARHYLEIERGAVLTGDTSELRRLSSTRCAECGRFAAQIERIYEAGGWLNGPAYEFSKVECGGIVGPRYADEMTLGILVDVMDPGLDLYTGDALREIEAEDLRLGMHLHWATSHWEVWAIGMRAEESSSNETEGPESGVQGAQSGGGDS